MKKSGFSMIEMLVVVAVIVMLASSIVVGVGSFGRFRASSDLGTFNSFLRSEFMKAVRDRQYIRVVVSMEDRAYWSESSETPFFISSGEKTLEKKQRTEEMLEKMEDSISDPFENMGAAIGADSIFQKAKLMGNEDDLENDDLYNYENFIPDRRSIKEVLKPEFETVSEKKKFDKNLVVTAFYAYHTPDIVTPDTLKEDDDDKEKDRNMYIYIFPEGRIEPFYLSLGKDEEGELFTYAFITSDMFMNIKIKPGGFEEELQDFTDLFEDQDAEGKS